MQNGDSGGCALNLTRLQTYWWQPPEVILSHDRMGNVRESRGHRIGLRRTLFAMRDDAASLGQGVAA